MNIISVWLNLIISHAHFFSGFSNRLISSNGILLYIVCNRVIRSRLIQEYLSMIFFSLFAFKFVYPFRFVLIQRKSSDQPDVVILLTRIKLGKSRCEYHLLIASNLQICMWIFSSRSLCFKRSPRQDPGNSRLSRDNLGCYCLTQYNESHIKQLTKLAKYWSPRAQNHINIYNHGKLYNLPLFKFFQL